MTREEIIRNLKYTMEKHKNDFVKTFETNISAMCKDILDYLEQEPCEMTAEEYRQRMIKAFHNADCDELIAVCVLPTEKEFEHLEWLLKNHYKKEPCGDTISRQATISAIEALQRPIMREESNYYQFKFSGMSEALDVVENLPSVTSQQRMGRWIPTSNISKWGYKCSECEGIDSTDLGHFCKWCGAKMEVENG